MGHWFRHRTTEGDGSTRLIGAPCRSQEHNGLALAAGKLQLGAPAGRLFTQATLVLKDLGQSGRPKCQHQPRLAFGEIYQALPLSFEGGVVKHSQRRQADDNCYARHDEHEQNEAPVIPHDDLPTAQRRALL
ncbi:MAG: hypothetical protein WBW73_19815 [Rhodoplanes sp.]